MMVKVVHAVLITTFICFVASEKKNEAATKIFPGVENLANIHASISSGSLGRPHGGKPSVGGSSGFGHGGRPSIGAISGGFGHGVRPSTGGISGGFGQGVRPSIGGISGGFGHGVRPSTGVISGGFGHGVRPSTGVISGGFGHGVRPSIGVIPDGFGHGGVHGGIGHGGSPHGGVGVGGFPVGHVGGGVGAGFPGVPHGGTSSGCRYWCKNSKNQFYCCESDDEAPGPVGIKPGYCPPVRPACPGSKFGPPQKCSNDYSCPGIEKCCEDTCLGFVVCKAPDKTLGPFGDLHNAVDGGHLGPGIGGFPHGSGVDGGHLGPGIGGFPHGSGVGGFGHNVGAFPRKKPEQ